MIEWLAWMPADRAVTVMFVLGGAVTALLASACLLGALWALRGRPALQIPACGRCRALLRGADTAVPVACPECGAPLDSDRAVRWLRFRRQPLTLLITAPVLFVGGTMLAAGAAYTLLSEPLEAAHQRRRELNRATALALRDSSDAAELEEALPDSDAAAILRVRAGGRRGDRALRQLAVGLRPGARAGVALQERDVNDAVELVRDLISGAAPLRPFEPPMSNGRASSVHALCI